MRIGIPKEIKDHEYRVGATPDMVRLLVQAHHSVVVEEGAGKGAGFTDEMFVRAGAHMMKRKEVWEAALIIKVKEPQPSEFEFMREGQILFCYFHLAPEPELTRVLVEKKVIAIAYETVTDAQGKLPLLLPMSEVAGRIAIQAGATALEMAHGGRGVLLGGVPGVAPGKVVILGGGISGTEAARMALGLGADVTILDVNLKRLRELDALYGPTLKTLYSSPLAVEREVEKADLVVGAVLVPGKLAPRLITREMVSRMQPGACLVDVSIDQGGCSETSRPTTHSQPTYVVDNVVHYCVTNMPGATPRTSTLALTQATVSYALKIANLGYTQALLEDPGFMGGLNVCLGKVTHPAVAADLGYDYTHPETAMLAKATDLTRVSNMKIRLTRDSTAPTTSRSSTR